MERFIVSDSPPVPAGQSSSNGVTATFSGNPGETSNLSAEVQASTAVNEAQAQTATATATATAQARTTRQQLLRQQHEDLADAELPHIRGRKWKKLCSLRIKYANAPIYFEEVLPDELEGKLSNFVFATRIRAVNEILSSQKTTVRDVSHIWRNGISFAMLAITAVVVVTLDLTGMKEFPLYFGLLLTVFVVWSFLQAWASVEPKYERNVSACCQSWSQDDSHLHLAYTSRRFTIAPRTIKLTDAILNSFRPAETEWRIRIWESVAVLPVNLYGIHREDGSAWTAATVDVGDVERRALPQYVPPWDATPCPEYCVSLVREEVGGSAGNGVNSRDGNNASSETLV